ncbi:MAG: hypothetical protein SF182_30640 [Deltaproteobacteria bacterium]|nr:hypothetical protein [Deltaproteobacteria bacterium]
MRRVRLIAHRSSLIALLILFACRSAPADPSAGLEAAVRGYYAGMASTDAAENRRAMDALAVTRDDVAALLPAHVDAVWAVWGPEREQLLGAAPQHAEHFRAAQPIGTVTGTDLRASADIVLSRSIEELPAAVPVYGVTIDVSGPEHQRAAGAFLFVRGRWVWMWELQRLGAIVGDPAGRS